MGVGHLSAAVVARPRACGLGPLRAAAGAAGLAAMLAAATLLVVGAAAGRSIVVPAGVRRFPGWLAGPLGGHGEPVTFESAGVLLCVLLGGYLLGLWGARALGARPVIAAIVALHVVFLLGPPLFSADVFGYVDWARMGALHDLNPYLHDPGSVPLDPVVPFLRWRNGVPPYGPLFTLFSYAVAPLGVPAAFWALKAIAAAASLGLVALVWHLAQRTGRDPVVAAAFVGLNPALLAFEVSGAHNDVLMMLVTMAGVALVLRDRVGAGAAAVVTAAAAKLSAAIVLPFLLAGAPRRRGAALAGGAAAGAVAVAVGVAAFGAQAGAFTRTLDAQQSQIATHSVPAAVGRVLGLGGVTPGVRVVAALLLAAGVAVALRAARRDWVAAAGWGTLAVLLTTAWLLPWYVTWLLPLAAVGRSTALRAAALAFTAYVIATRVSFLLA